MKPMLIIFGIFATLFVATEYTTFFFILIGVIILIGIIVAASSEKNKFSNSNEKGSLNSNPKQLNFDLNFTESKLNLDQAKYIILDVETTGLPKYRDAEPENLAAWPFVVQFSWAIFDDYGHLIKLKTHIIKPRIPIPIEASNIHKITTELAIEKGIDPIKVFSEFIEDAKYDTIIIAHNIDFDLPILEAEFIRNGFGKQFVGKNKICTMKSTTQYCGIPKSHGRGYKYPKLTELFGLLFAHHYDVTIPGAHDSEIDTLMTAKCFFYLKDRIEMKLIKGKKNWIPEIKPLLYDPDNDFMDKPEFRKLNKKKISDPSLYTRHEYYKKLIIKDWNKLYNPEKGKLGVYGLDRFTSKVRLNNTIYNLSLVLNQIDMENEFKQIV